MTLPTFWNDSWSAALGNHLWQSTEVIQSQIGLKLDFTMASVEVVVIDHAEKPEAD
ncbi:MAG: hypothetical protein WAN35_12965 [Terracidiphilus sp.]